MWDKRALRWFGLVIVPGDGWILTHRGWSNVNRAYTSDNPSKTGWGKSLQNAQHADVSEKTACAVDSEGRLTVWDRDLDRSSPGILTQSVNAVQATSKGCFIRGNGHSQFYDRAGEKVVLPSWRAIGVSDGAYLWQPIAILNQIVERYRVGDQSSRPRQRLQMVASIRTRRPRSDVETSTNPQFSSE